MIVNQNIEGWEVISQNTHGLLAGKLAGRLKSSLRPDHWEDVLTAIIEHDDRLLDFDEKNYLTEVGTPLDFTLDKRSDHDAYQHAGRVYENALQKSSLVAMLIGRHLEFLFAAKEGDHSGFKNFFRQVRSDRKTQSKLYGWNTKKLESAYKLMRFCDRLSLLLCQSLVPLDGRKVEINQSIADSRYFIWKDGKNFKIDSWPFEEDGYEIDFEFRMLRQATFKSNDQLSKAIADSDVYLKVIEFSK